jgi:hypothetical protein
MLDAQMKKDRTICESWRNALTLLDDMIGQ